MLGNYLAVMKQNSDKTWEAFAAAQTCSVTIQRNMIEVSSKDHGQWVSNLPGKISWSMSTQNLYTEANYDEMYNLMIKHQRVLIHFTKVDNEDATDTNENYGSATYALDGKGNNIATYGNSTKPCYGTGVIDSNLKWEEAADAKTCYEGYCYISNLAINANDGETASYTVEFTGTGPLIDKKGTAPTVDTEDENNG